MTIHFNIETLGDIHSIVVPAQTRLMSSCQGKADVGQIAVRDIGQTRASFPLGKRVTVDKDGAPPIYGGYLIRARRRFWFNVDEPDTLQRLWILDVVDNNILFSKRVIHKLSNPEQIEGPSYPTDTADTVVIDELVTNWLDLSADGIDVESNVHGVANVNAGQTFYPFNAGQTWGQAMASIAGNPAAVWGLDPDWVLYYGDADEPDAPFVLSDVPFSGGGVDVTDDFDRSVASNPTGWGTGDIGTWQDDSFGTPAYSVNGTQGVVDDSGQYFTSVPFPAAATGADHWNSVVKFQWPDPEDDPTTRLHSLSFFDNAVGDNWGVTVIIRALPFPRITLEWYTLDDGNDDFISFADGAEGTWAYMELDLTLTTGVLRCRYWEEGDPVPDWMITLTGAGPFGSTGYISLMGAWSADTSPPFATFLTEYVSFTAVAGDGPAESAGYREATIYDDMMQGANDFLAIGFGQGRARGVVARVTDGASIAEHGLWQDAMVNYAVWKQATINRIADRAVNGSPSSKRGRKDPRVLVEAVTFEDGLRVGQKVRFVSSAHDFDDVLPIRQMELTFPAPDVIRYEMKLTHEIDATWNTIDPLPFIKIPPGHIPDYVFPPDIPDITDEGECDGITDSFTRTSVGGWTTSDAGIPWIESQRSYPGLLFFTLDGSHGVVTSINTDPDLLIEHDRIDLTLDPSATRYTIKCLISDYQVSPPASALTSITFGFDLGNDRSVDLASVFGEITLRDGPSDTKPFDYNGDPFWVYIAVEPTATGVWIWYDGEEMPLENIVGVFANHEDLVPCVGFKPDVGISPHSFKVDHLEVTINDVLLQNCESDPVPLSGTYCETLDFVDGVTYATTARFVAGSEEVRVNGLLARPVSISNPDGQYTVPIDRQSIEFTDPYDPEDVVKICYTVD